MGDTSDSAVPSRVNAWLGVPDEPSVIIGSICMVILFVSALSTIILDVIDLVQVRPRYSIVDAHMPTPGTPPLPVGTAVSEPSKASDRWRLRLCAESP